MKNVDQVYIEVASKLISKLRTLGETRIIAALGFILAFRKTDSMKKLSNSIPILAKYQILELDSLNTIRLSDISNMDDRTIISIVDIINSIPNLDRATLFEQIILAYASTEGRGIEMFYQPKELTYLVSELLKEKSIQSLYNPFAGSASYQLIERGLKCYSQEINKDTWLIGKIRLFLNDIPNYFEHTDSIQNWAGDSKSFDAIVATPPLGLRLVNNSSTSDDNLRFKHKQLESWFIEKSINSISQDGIVISVVPLSFLTQASSTDFREYLLKEHYIKKIIELPKNLFSTIGIATALVVLTRTPNDTVVMVDAKSFCKQEGRQNVLLYKELLAEIIAPFSKYVKSISKIELRENEYDLNPSLYLMEPIKVPSGSKLVKLKNLTSMFRGGIAKLEKSRLIKPFNLSTDKFSFIKTYEELDEVEIINPAIILDRDVLLLSTMGQLRVNYFQYSSSFCVACSKLGILPLQINTDTITPEYLIGELSKDYVVKQIEVRSTGVSGLNAKDILEIEILVPSSIEDQKSIFEADKRQYQEDKIKELGLEIDLLKVSKSTEFERNMDLRRHALGQVLNGFMPTFTLLNACRSKNDGILRDETIVAARTGETVKDYFQKLELYSLKLEKLVNILVDQNTYGETNPMDIKLFVEKYITEHPTQGYKLELSYTDFDDYYTETSVELETRHMIKMSEKDLTQVLDNIITNAKKHGFVDPGRGDYTIRIDLSLLAMANSDGREMYAIRIANNGEPLDKGMDKTKLFHWGVGKNTGFGAWQVKNIVEHFGGMVQLYEFSNDPLGFEIEYELIFPKLITN